MANHHVDYDIWKHAVLLLLMWVSTEAFSTTLTLRLEPGRLAMYMERLNDVQPEGVVLEGMADVHDFECFRRFPPSVKALDMSDLTIVPGFYAEGAFNGEVEFHANELPAYALFDMGLEQMALPSNLEIIGEGALAALPLTKIEIPATVRKIGDYAFYNCTKLKEVSCGSRLTEIGKSAFMNCGSLSEITVPESVIHIGDKAFFGCGLRSANMPDVERIGDYAFAATPSLRDVTVQRDVVLGKGVFFCASAIDTVAGLPPELPEMLFAHAVGAPAGKGIYGAVSIGNYALAGNKAETVILGEKLEYVGDHAFADMPNLKTVEATPLNLNIPQAHEEAFGDARLENIRLNVLHEYVDSWKADPYWGRFAVTGVSVGVETLPGEDVTVKVRLSDGVLTVSASSAIDSVEVFTFDGNRLLLAYPNVSEYVWTPDSSAAPLIVRTVCGTCVRIIKIGG